MKTSRMTGDNARKLHAFLTSLLMEMNGRPPDWDPSTPSSMSGLDLMTK